jgi:hypothetical protein
MTVVTVHRLADAPLCLAAVRQERIEKIADMAAILVDKGCFADYSDSIMVLAAAGYHSFEIFAFLPDARHVAEQHVVAMEMSEP